MNADEQEYVQLCWKILEAKCIYYRLNGVHKKAVSDADYDVMERRYRLLSAKLNKEPTTVTMVGFDASRPSCQSVMEKLCLIV